MLRRSALISALVVLGVTAWTLSRWSACARGTDLARRKARELQVVQSEAQRITQLRRLPRLAAETTPDREYLHAFLEEVAQSVGLPPTAIASIQPAEPARLGQSAYLEVTTTVTLQSVSLRQLAELVFLVGQRRPEFHLKELRLSQTNRPQALFSATLTFAFLVFQPTAEAN